MTRSEAIEKAAVAFLNAYDGCERVATTERAAIALRAALAQPPGPAPSMEEVERLVGDIRRAPWLDECVASLLRAIRALPDRYEEGWRAGVEAARSAAWMEAGQSMLGDETLKRIDSRIRDLPTPNPEDRR